MKIGIFGGTFDPPHIGHVGICKFFIEKYNFDRVFVIPVYCPPHKCMHSDASAEDRMSMSRLAFENLSNKVVVSDIEIKRQGKSYTADTIRQLKEDGYDDIYFLCGTYMILTIDRWYNPKYIFENATIVYARREDEPEISAKIDDKVSEYKSKYGARVEFLDANVLEVSSTEIRNSVAFGDFGFLSNEVAEYVKEHRLYVEG